jgi:nitroimidazol reductase NimA-like FMN-containing flavoprotein (pyridoxamine 5'-phosphate oxidase superfamily)
MPDQIPQTWEAAAAVFAAAPFCHVAFVEDGLPRALPVLHALEGRTLYVHGSPDSSVIRAAASGAPVSVSAVVLDGVVVAHSACQSSVNYRSVLGSGTGRRVDDPAEMERALRTTTERLTPGAWDRGRSPRPQEMALTLVAAVDIHDFSIRVRTGPARESAADRALPVWSGIVPLRLTAGAPIPDPGVPPGTPVPPVLPGCLPSAGPPGLR